MNRKDTDILLALPMAYQDGLDKFNGISRCLRVRRSGRYNIHLVREKLDLAELRTRLDDGIGAVIGDTVHFTDETLRELVRRNLPTVMFNPCEPDPFPAESTRIAYVRLDSNEIGRRACSFLQGQGAYASFGFVNDRAFRPWSRQREAAYVAALKESGITAHCYRPGSPETTFNAEARKHLQEWLRSLPKPAAVFVSDDIRCEEVLHVCCGAGLKVPDDIALLGVDDDQLLCLRSDPPLSSIHPDCEYGGYLAMDLLSRMLRGERVPRNSVVPIKEIVGRRSTAPSSPAGRLVERAMEIIKNDACTIHAVDEIAGRLKVSRRLLDLRFREIKGSSIVDALIDERLRRVSILLESTSLSVSEIADLTGFRTETYLMRLYKSRYGHTMRAR